jgi:hypothetical protein
MQTTIDNSAVLSAAIQYADAGYPVFPCIPGGKRPLTARGFHDASTNVDQIESWWTENPTANIAIPMAGLFCVDVDGPQNSWPGINRQQSLEIASMATTPRGGRHFLFRQPDGKEWRCTESKLAPNVDTRADGGYIVVSPSVTDVGQYRWITELEPRDRLPLPPDWLIAAIDDLGAVRTNRSIAWSENKIPHGVRHSTLVSLGGGMRRMGMSQSEIEAALWRVNIERCDSAGTQDEIAAIARGVAKYEPDQIAVALVEDHWGQIRQSPEYRSSSGPVNPGPFPEKLLTVPGLISDIMEYNREACFKHQAINDLAGAIALVGVITGRKICDEVGTRTNIYTIAVADSGSGKETPRKTNKTLLSAAGCESMIGPEECASGAGLIAAVEKCPALLLQLDETGRMLKSINNAKEAPHLAGIITNLMKLFTSSNSIYVGAAYADAKRNKIIRNPHCCFYGTTVAESLYASLTAEAVTDGFLSRILLFECPDEIVSAKRPKIQPIPEHMLRTVKLWRDFNPGGGNLQDVNPEAYMVPSTYEAQSIFESLNRESEDSQRSLGKPLGSLWTRACEKANKLALIYACSRNFGSLVIDKPAAEWAVELSRYLTQRLIFLASKHIAENPWDAKRKRILRIIEESGADGISRSELLRKTKSYQTKERSDILDALKVCGDVVEQIQPTGGAPKTIYLASAYL